MVAFGLPDLGRAYGKLQQGIRLGATWLVVATLTDPARAASPLAEYRVASGCPARQVFELDLLRRLREQTNGILAVVVEQLDGSYIGHAVWTSNDSVVTERVVRDDSCDQVLHALALIGVLLLEQEPPPQPMSRTSDASTAKNHAKPPPITAAAPRTVAAPSRPGDDQNRHHPITEPKRGTWLQGPVFALSGDYQFAPSFRLGPRLGWALSNHAILRGSQVELNGSVARLTSGELGGAERSADITWTSVRLDACYGRGARDRSTLGACAWFDTGKLAGMGQVNGQSRSAGTFWSRIGAGIHSRQALVGPLVLDVKVGAMLALSRPEFYFAAAEGMVEATVHHVPLLGFVADVGLGLLIW